MGYSTNAALIVQNEELLAEVLASVQAGKEVSFALHPGANLSSEQYRLRRVLTATNHFPNTLGGRFAGLGDLVRVVLDWKEQKIIVRPKQLGKSNSAALALAKAKPNEAHALEVARGYAGTILTLEFYPSESFSLASFSAALESIGFELFASAIERFEDGKLLIPVERTGEATFVSRAAPRRTLPTNLRPAPFEDETP